MYRIINCNSESDGKDNGCRNIQIDIQPSHYMAAIGATGKKFGTRDISNSRSDPKNKKMKMLTDIMPTPSPLKMLLTI